ncbi:unnamed protein product [Peniophora sp. CBMAI 1063]|nr:unnamed protein product [Peniophora sp. CBMAI 1063]
MTSIEQHSTQSDALSTSPGSEPISFELIDAPAVVDVEQPISGDNVPAMDADTLAQAPCKPAGELISAPGTPDIPSETTIPVHTILRHPLIVHAIAARARTFFLVKDFARLKRAVVPPSEPPKTHIKLKALNLRAAVHVLLSTISDDTEFCSRLARHPVLAALAAHQASDPGSLAFTYILINSEEGEELARRAAAIHAARVRDWFALRAVQAMPVYESLTGAARAIWEQSMVWAPSLALSGSAVALFLALDS